MTCTVIGVLAGLISIGLLLILGPTRLWNTLKATWVLWKTELLT